MECDLREAFSLEPLASCTRVCVLTYIHMYVHLYYVAPLMYCVVHMEEGYRLIAGGDEVAVLLNQQCV